MSRAISTCTTTQDRGVFGAGISSGNGGGDDHATRSGMVYAFSHSENPCVQTDTSNPCAFRCEISSSIETGPLISSPS